MQKNNTKLNNTSFKSTFNPNISTLSLSQNIRVNPYEILIVMKRENCMKIVKHRYNNNKKINRFLFIIL